MFLILTYDYFLDKTNYDLGSFLNYINCINLVQFWKWFHIIRTLLSFVKIRSKDTTLFKILSTRFVQFRKWALIASEIRKIMSSDSIAWFNFLYLSYSSSSVISFIANFTSLLLFSFLSFSSWKEKRKRVFEHVCRAC